MEANMGDSNKMKLQWLLGTNDNPGISWHYLQLLAKLELGEADKIDKWARFNRFIREELKDVEVK
jgi:hypothetical protein